MFSETKEELATTQETLKETEQDLTETKDTLKTTTTNLYRTRKDRDEQKHLVSQHIKSETKLHEQASQVLKVNFVGNHKKQPTSGQHIEVVSPLFSNPKVVYSV